MQFAKRAGLHTADTWWRLSVPICEERAREWGGSLNQFISFIAVQLYALHSRAYARLLKTQQTVPIQCKTPQPISALRYVCGLHILQILWNLYISLGKITDKELGKRTYVRYPAGRHLNPAWFYEKPSLQSTGSRERSEREAYNLSLVSRFIMHGISHPPSCGAVSDLMPTCRF